MAVESLHGVCSSGSNKISCYSYAYSPTTRGDNRDSATTTVSAASWWRSIPYDVGTYPMFVEV
jgi:hypothetical protein